MTKPYDEPAFPVPDSAAYQYGGMSLRDWFAGQCIMGFEPMSPDDAKTLAASSYWMADAMLAERSKP